MAIRTPGVNGSRHGFVSPIALCAAFAAERVSSRTLLL
jgi:hypothetical protein